MKADYDYYVQTGKTDSIRRYPKRLEEGQRWDEATQQWVDHCAPRQSCVLTKDKEITEPEAESKFPTCTTK
jgi:hypothetical protein